MEVTVDSLVFHILQNSIYVQQKKETYSGLWWDKYKTQTESTDKLQN